MLFWFDRLQFDEINNSLIIFEFFETNENYINSVTKDSWNEELAEQVYDKFTFEKHKVIRHIMNNRNIVYYVILYSLYDNEKKKVLKYYDYELEVYEYNNFFELQRWFLAINNDTRTKWSKPLGGIKSGTDYSKELIKKYWKENVNEDDQGREFTEKLLTKYNTNGQVVKGLNGNIQKYNTLGFDFDMFVYLPKSEYLLNIEFAYNQKLILPNINCTPMRYCWGNGSKNVNDNKRKYNNLWKATQLLGGKFAILNYTDENNDKHKDDDMFGLSIINELDEELGFRNETKYHISRNNFEIALKKCIDDNCTDLSCFKHKADETYNYNSKYFDIWINSNKKKNNE